MKRIIKSLLDTDFYTFTVMQAIFHNYINTHLECEFKWRNWQDMHLNISIKDFVARVNEQLDMLCELRFKQDELAYLNTDPNLTSDFIEYLRLFQLNRAHIQAYVQGDYIMISVAGPAASIVMFETPTLAIVSELYTRHNGIPEATWIQKARKNLKRKLEFIDSVIYKGSDFNYGDFGTRRRATRDWHFEALQTMKEHGRLAGTSNVLFAKELGISHLGTQNHLWFQIHQQLGVSLIDSQAKALQVWADEYRGNLGIALSDCITFDAFLVDFDLYFSKLFDGCRHDSGDPYTWCEKLIAHYKSMRIDPRTKTALFSDGLNMHVAAGLYNAFNSQIKCAFGIGTHLTNDCGFIAPQIVIKAIACNGAPVAKISDSAGKGMCKDQEYLRYLKKVIVQKTGNEGFVA